MDEDITINDNDEPYIMYRKATEINHRLQYGIPLKTTEETKRRWNVSDGNMFETSHIQDAEQTFMKRGM